MMIDERALFKKDSLISNFKTSFFCLWNWRRGYQACWKWSFPMSRSIRHRSVGRYDGQSVVGGRSEKDGNLHFQRSYRNTWDNHFKETKKYSNVKFDINKCSDWSMEVKLSAL